MREVGSPGDCQREPELEQQLEQAGEAEQQDIALQPAEFLDAQGPRGRRCAGAHAGRQV